MFWFAAAMAKDKAAACHPLCQQGDRLEPAISPETWSQNRSGHFSSRTQSLSAPPIWQVASVHQDQEVTPQEQFLSQYFIKSAKESFWAVSELKWWMLNMACFCDLCLTFLSLSQCDAAVNVLWSSPYKYNSWLIDPATAVCSPMTHGHILYTEIQMCNNTWVVCCESIWQICLSQKIPDLSEASE